jgi:hypothetical protein
MVKTSYEPCCYTSTRHVLHRRSAYRSWSLNAQACAAQEKRIQELESERDQGSRILPSILSPAIPPQPSLVIQNSIVPNEPAGYIDSRMVDELRELGF